MPLLQACEGYITALLQDDGRELDGSKHDEVELCTYLFTLGEVAQVRLSVCLFVCLCVCVCLFVCVFVCALDTYIMGISHLVYLQCVCVCGQQGCCRGEGWPAEPCRGEGLAS